MKRAVERDREGLREREREREGGLNAGLLKRVGRK